MTVRLADSVGRATPRPRLARLRRRPGRCTRVTLVRRTSSSSATSRRIVPPGATGDGGAAASWPTLCPSSGSGEYTTEVPWEMVLCGTGSDPEICPQ